MTDTPIQHVSDTALWIAAHRATESERPDALFKDPYATLLAGDRGRHIAKRMARGKMTEWSVVVRTTIIDRFLQQLIAAGADTVLNLGAGLDTRPYRMALPATLKWIEVDYPHIVRLKEERLADIKPVCQLERVAADLSGVDARQSFFADVAAKSKSIVVLTEGLVPYLTPAEVATLARDLKMHTQFKHWIVEYYAPQMARYLRGGKRAKQMRNSPFQFFVDDWEGFFKTNGFALQEMRYLATEGRKLGRPVPLPWHMRLAIKLGPKAKADKGERTSGYAILTPI